MFSASRSISSKPPVSQIHVSLAYITRLNRTRFRVPIEAQTRLGQERRKFLESSRTAEKLEDEKKTVQEKLDLDAKARRKQARSARPVSQEKLNRRLELDADKVLKERLRKANRVYFAEREKVKTAARLEWLHTLDKFAHKFPDGQIEKLKYSRFILRNPGRHFKSESLELGRQHKPLPYQAFADQLFEDLVNNNPAFKTGLVDKPTSEVEIPIPEMPNVPPEAREFLKKLVKLDPKAAAAAANPDVAVDAALADMPDGPLKTQIQNMFKEGQNDKSGLRDIEKFIRDYANLSKLPAYLNASQESDEDLGDEQMDSIVEDMDGAPETSEEDVLSMFEGVKAKEFRKFFEQDPSTNVTESGPLADLLKKIDYDPHKSYGNVPRPDQALAQMIKDLPVKTDELAAYIESLKSVNKASKPEDDKDEDEDDEDEDDEDEESDDDEDEEPEDDEDEEPEDDEDEEPEDEKTEEALNSQSGSQNSETQTSKSQTQISETEDELDALLEDMKRLASTLPDLDPTDPVQAHVMKMLNDPLNSKLSADQLGQILHVAPEWVKKMTPGQPGAESPMPNTDPLLSGLLEKLGKSKQEGDIPEKEILEFVTQSLKRQFGDRVEMPPPEKVAEMMASARLETKEHLKKTGSKK